MKPHLHGAYIGGKHPGTTTPVLPASGAALRDWSTSLGSGPPLASQDWRKTGRQLREAVQLAPPIHLQQGTTSPGTPGTICRSGKPRDPDYTQGQRAKGDCCTSESELQHERRRFRRNRYYKVFTDYNYVRQCGKDYHHSPSRHRNEVPARRSSIACGPSAPRRHRLCRRNRR